MVNRLCLPATAGLVSPTNYAPLGDQGYQGWVGGMP
jgi:hypothetical protein